MLLTITTLPAKRVAYQDCEGQLGIVGSKSLLALA